MNKMIKGNGSMILRVTFTSLVGLWALAAASCSDSSDSSSTNGGSAAVGGSNVSSGGMLSSGGNTNAGGVPGAGGPSAIAGTTAGSVAIAGATAAAGTVATAGSAAIAGATAAAGTAAAAGSLGTAGGTVLSYPAWSFSSDMETWVGATNATLSIYSGSDTFCSSGCAQMTGNLTSNGTAYTARIVFDSPLDLSGGVSIRAAVKYVVPAGTDDFGTIAVYAQDGESVSADDDNWANGMARGNKSAENGLAAPAGATLEFNLPASKVAVETTLTPGGVAKQGFNPALIKVIGLVVVSGSASQVGTTTFLVDQITVSKL